MTNYTKLRIILLLIFLGISLTGFAQTQLGQELLIFQSDKYLLKTEEQDNIYTFKITNTEDNAKNKTFSIPSSMLEPDIFKKLFEENIKAAAVGDATILDSNNSIKVTNYETEILSLFYRIRGIISVKDNLKDQPFAGRLYYKSSVTAYKSTPGLHKKLEKQIRKKATYSFPKWTYKDTMSSKEYYVEGKKNQKKRNAKKILEQVLLDKDLSKGIVLQETLKKLQKILDTVSNQLNKISTLSDRKKSKLEQQKLVESQTKAFNANIGKVRLDSTINSGKIDSLRIALLELTVEFNDMNLNDSLKPVLDSEKSEDLSVNIQHLSDNIRSMADSLTHKKNGLDAVKTAEDVRLDAELATLTSPDSIANAKKVSEILQKQLKEKISDIELALNKLSTYNTVVSTNLKQYMIALIKSGSQIESLEELLHHKDGSLPGLKDQIADLDTLITIADTIKEASLNRLKIGLVGYESQLNNYFSVPITIDTITIEFNEGYIENFMTSGLYDKSQYISWISDTVKSLLPNEVQLFGKERIKLENQYPIGFTSKRNYWRLKGNGVYHYSKGKNGSPIIRADLGDIINYYQKHQVDRKDFSPANQITVIYPQRPGDKYKDLKKASRKNLLELRIYTDFVGFDQNEPNGLIQLDVYGRKNIVSERYYKNNALVRNANLGFFQYLIYGGTISKIEDDDRQLELSKRENDFFASTLDLRQYQNKQIGVNFNLATLDFHHGKTTLLIETGVRYGRTSLSDSTNIIQANPDTNGNFGVNTYELNVLKFSSLFRTDEDIQLRLDYNFNLFYTRNDNVFQQIANNSLFLENGKSGNGRNVARYNNFQMEVTFNPNLNPDNEPIDNVNRWFFRYNYNWQLGFWRTGFHQIQLGYSMPLFKKIGG